MNYITLCLSDADGKLEANWLGPYTVKTVGPNHQAVLEKDGVLLKHKVNFGQLKPYYLLVMFFYCFSLGWVLHISSHCIK